MGRWRTKAEWPDFNVEGVVEFSEHDPHPVALVAHELGHACAREEDLEARDNGVAFTWALEMCADSYAYKWGFGREIARDRKRRDMRHHGPALGATSTIEGNYGVMFRYHVTWSFYMRLVQTETRERQLIETAAQIKARLREWREQMQAHPITPP